MNLDRTEISNSFSLFCCFYRYSVIAAVQLLIQLISSPWKKTFQFLSHVLKISDDS